MEVMPVASQPIYQFYAELKDYKPLIWRRFQVAGNITLAQLGYPPTKHSIDLLDRKYCKTN